jgi:hypothetical protein
MRKTIVRNTAKIESRKQWIIVIMSLFLIFLFVASIFAYYVGGNSNQNTSEGGYRFSVANTKEGQFWSTKINKTTVYAAHLPSQTLDVPVNGSLDIVKNAPAFAVTYANVTEDGYAVGYVSSRLHEDILILKKTLYEGTTVNVSDQIPIISCENATLPTIQFVLGESNSINSDGNCITASSIGGTDTALVADRLRYELLGVRNE